MRWLAIVAAAGFAALTGTQATAQQHPAEGAPAEAAKPTVAAAMAPVAERAGFAKAALRPGEAPSRPVGGQGRVACDHSVVLTDAYGDGWGTGHLDVYVNGALVLGGATCAGAGPDTYSFPADTGDTIDVYYLTPDAWPYENDYCVYDGAGTPLGCANGAGIPPDLLGLIGNCVSGGLPGEDCGSATVIGALPYSNAGTTVGYLNDYDEICPFTGSTAPDVVYSYTAPADTCVEITLCNGSTYDTKLYVYENTCATPPHACNDDACPGYVSELSDALNAAVPMTAGNTYYIVVDGYGSGSGTYVIDLTEVPCADKCAPPGDDCFSTPCDGTTSVEFGGASPIPPIPADFFYPGSPPFSGVVSLGGPGGFPGDTIVHRMDVMCFPDPLPAVASTPVEITQLILGSCNPIDVGGSLYDVVVTHDPALSGGTITATKENADGGTFTSTLHVEAQISFELTGGGPPVGVPISAPVDLTSGPDPWLQADPGFTWCGASGFFPGWLIGGQGSPCCVVSCHESNTPGHPHCVQMPDCPKCPPDPDPHGTVPGDPTGGGTVVDFGAPDVGAIPADFFEPGSDPFTGLIPLQGGPGVDTLILRSGPPVCPSPLPSTCDVIEIEIVALVLHSTEPIVVMPGGGLWDVDLTLSATPPPAPGTLQATKEHANGGYFSSQLPVMPQFTFTSVDNPSDVRVLDYGAEGMTPIGLNFDTVPWVVTLALHLEGTVEAPDNGSFVPGVLEVVPGDPNSQIVVEANGNSSPSGGGGVNHGVTPLTFCPLPAGDSACAALQQTDCEGSVNDLCRPTIAQVVAGQAVAILCDCIEAGDKCGPIDISPGGDTITCPGGCPQPNPPGPCVIFVDGLPDPSGASTLPAIAIPDGALVTCDCPGGQPPDPHRTVDPTSVDFSGVTPDAPPIPADFFGPGSDPFEGIIPMGGSGSGADTLVQRAGPLHPPDPCDPMPCPNDPVAIEIVALTLRSIAPITVTFGGGSTEQWDVELGLSDFGSSGLGLLESTRTHDNGGYYTAWLPVLPKLIFTNVDIPGDIRTLDFGADGLAPVEINFGLLEPVPWVVYLGPTLQGLVLAPNEGDFVPGVDELVPGDPNSQVVVNVPGESKGGGVDHTVTPVTYCPVVDPDPVFDPCGPYQQTDCEGSVDNLCRPIAVHVQGGQAVAILCDCIEPGDKCGPIDIGPGGVIVSCPGGCPPPNPVGFCEVYADGIPTGESTVPAPAFEGATLTCQCTELAAIGACCFTDGNCAEVSAAACSAANGAYQGDDTLCGDFGGCCYDADGIGGPEACQDMFEICCSALGGSFQGAGVVCSGVTVACCNLADGTLCADVDPLCCDDLGGTVSPYSAVCLGDGNSNGTDDACEPPVEHCPLVDDQAIDPCAALQDPDCILDPVTDEQCRPTDVQEIGGTFVATACACISPDVKCGPIDILPSGAIMCPGGCPPPNPAGSCYIHADGVSLERDTAFPGDPDIPAGSTLTCACTTPPIPTVSEWGMVILTVLLLAAAGTVMRRRRAVTG